MNLKNPPSHLRCSQSAMGSCVGSTAGPIGVIERDELSESLLNCRKLIG
jgi:hypothetical protein